MCSVLLIQLSFLHIYHHATIGAIWGYLIFLGYGNGTSAWGAFINSVVHFLMYSHYLWTSFGLKNPLKKIITRFQIFQFYTCLAHVPAVMLVDTFVPKSLCTLQFGYHITMVVLFSSFYSKTYRKADRLKRA